jgi:SAM-dependent methyltransferase
MSTPLYRYENLELLASALLEDEYDDECQDVSTGVSSLLGEHQRFLEMFLPSVENSWILELGCGSGELAGSWSTHGIEACPNRLARAQERAKACDLPEHNYRLGWVERLPDDWNECMDAVFMLNGWFQLRSDYEALIEVNRVMRVGGRFIINLLTTDEVDVVCGRVLGPRNYVRVVSAFGFELVGKYSHDAGERFSPYTMEGVCLAFEKVRPFDPAYLRLLQVTDKSCLKNYHQPRDWKLL